MLEQERGDPETIDLWQTNIIRKLNIVRSEEDKDVACDMALLPAEGLNLCLSLMLEEPCRSE